MMYAKLWLSYPGLSYVIHGMVREINLSFLFMRWDRVDKHVFTVLSVKTFSFFCLAGLTAAELSGRQAGNEDSPRSL